jgi:hypothetical protein
VTCAFSVPLSSPAGATDKGRWGGREPFPPRLPVISRLDAIDRDPVVVRLIEAAGADGAALDRFTIPRGVHRLEINPAVPRIQTRLEFAKARDIYLTSLIR